MTPLVWPCPAPDGSETGEYALAFDQGRAKRLLILPALFDEANKLRRLTVEVMRRLDAAGIDAILPDLPGTGESLADPAAQTLTGWTAAALAAVNHFRATHLLALRGGGLVLPQVAPGWHYAPVKGASLLRLMLRARVFAAREAGREETHDALLAQGLDEGLELNGYAMGAAMLGELSAAAPPERPGVTVIEHELVGGSPLWLRAEPDEDRDQADALAAVLAMGLGG
ncbi:MAG: hypothetical protein ACREBO_00220 [Novosphingobium sp.]